jgi:hypothetical protein
MARTAAMQEIESERTSRPIYFARPAGDWDGILTVPHHGRRSIEWPSHATATFGVAAEADLLSNYLAAHVIRSIQGLIDPYGLVTGDDPFEYRTIPLRRGRIVQAKVRHGDRLSAIPIDDD